MATTTTTTKTITGNGYTDENIKALQERVDKANEQLKTFNTNTAADEVLKKRAESEYTPIYNAQIGEQESARQSAQTALDERLGALNRQYARDSEELGRAYDTQKAATNNQMLARGMNNSSLALAMLNRVDEQRNRALSDLQAERTAGETTAQREYSDAVSAAEAAIARLKSDLAANVDSRYQQLKDAEDSRVMQAMQAQNQLTQYANELMLQIEQLRQQGYSQYLQQQQAAEEQNRWQQEFDFEKQQYADSQNKSSGGSGGSKTGTAVSQTPVQASKGSDLEQLYNSQGSTTNSSLKPAVNALKGTASAATGAVKSIADRLRDAVSKYGTTKAGGSKSGNTSKNNLKKTTSR